MQYRVPPPVVWGLLVLDVPGLQHAASQGVVVDVDHHGLGEIHSMIEGNSC